MGILESLLIATGLAMDATAVSMAIATAGYATHWRPRFRLAFHFGLFQGLMPILGWNLGRTVVEYVARWDHWLAFLLLGIIGVRMILGGIRAEAPVLHRNPTRGWSLVTLSVATSIDALAVGLSLSMLETGIWLPALLIAVVTAAFSLLAIHLGRLTSGSLGQKAEILGGVLLLAIGIRILVAHLTTGPM